MSNKPGYHVVPAALEKAAGAFTREGEETKTAADTFATLAQLPDSAFGNLPDSYNLANKYQAFFSQVQKDMKELEASLGECGRRLQVSADNYRHAEASNTIRRRRR